MVRRRQFLIAGGAAAGALALIGGGAVVFVLADQFGAWIEATLRRSLPGYSLEPTGLARFIDEYYARRKDYDRLRVFAAAHGVIDVTWALPRKLADDVEEEERLILTDFLVGSDFFDDYPRIPTEITYRGAAEACGNPFATF